MNNNPTLQSMRMFILIVFFLVCSSFALAVEVPLDSLITYHNFDNDSMINATAWSSSVDTINATLSSAMQTNKSGISKDAFYFNGSAKVLLDASSLWDFGEGNFTMQIWIKPDEYVTQGALYSDGVSDWWMGIIYGYFEGGGFDYRRNGTNLGFAMSNTGTNWVPINGLDTNNTATGVSGLAERGVWSQVVIRRCGDNASVVVNGTYLSTNATMTGALPTKNNPKVLGNWFTVASGYYFKGYMDEIGVWNECLSDEVVETLYNNGDYISYPFAQEVDNINLTAINPDSVTLKQQNVTAYLNMSSTFDTNCSWYINGSLNQTLPFSNGTATSISFSTNFTNGDYTHYIFCGNSTDNETSNTGTFTINMTSSIDLLFWNDTRTAKDTFDEGEDFYSIINWTDDFDGSPITNTQGTCNITTFDLLYENETFSNTDEDFTLCNSVCDYDTWTGNSTSITTDNAVMDYMYFDVCHEGVANQPLIVNISCTGASYQETIAASRFTTCDVGYSNVIVNTSVCIGELELTLILSNDAPTGSAHNFSSINYDRQFSELTAYEDAGTIAYNISSGLWETNIKTEEYIHGDYTIFGNCSHDTISDYDNSKSENITIVNIPPVIFVPELLDEDNVIKHNFTYDNVSDEVEFFNGTWQFIIEVIDNDLTEAIINITNSSGANVCSMADSYDMSLNCSSDIFVDIESSPFNVYVYANDSAGDATFLSFNFTVNDTVYPVVTGVSNTSVVNGSVYTWSVNVVDEYVWSWSINCSGGSIFNYSETSIGTDGYSWTNSTTINGLTLCSWRAADGHTDNKIKDYDIYKDIESGKLKFDDVELEILNDVEDMTWTKEKDRYSFCITTKTKDDIMSINVPSNCYPAYYSGYKGHYVCNDIKGNPSKWLDFEGEYEVSREGNNVSIYIKDAKDQEICFNSIGDLNINTGVQKIDIKPTSIGYFDTTECILDKGTAWVIGYIGLMFALLAIIIINIVWIRLPFAGIVIGLGWIIFTLPLYGCYTMFGAVFSFFGLLLMILEFWFMFRPNGDHG